MEKQMEKKMDNEMETGGIQFTGAILGSEYTSNTYIGPHRL